MSIPDGSVNAGGILTVEVVIDNANPFVAFQLDIEMPAALSYVASSAQLNAARKTDHVVSAEVVNGNILRIISYSMSFSSYLGNSGKVVEFQLQAGAQPGSYSLQPVNAIIAGIDGSNILTAAIAGTQTILAPKISPLASTLNFEEVALTTYHELAIQIQNTGNQNLSVSSIQFDSPYFSLQGGSSFVLSPGQTSLLTVRFNAHLKGNYQHTMTINSNDPAMPALAIQLMAVAFAVNELHCGNLLAHSGSFAELALSVNNMEAFTAIQFDLQLPAPLTYVAGSASLSARKTDHIIDASMINQNTLRVIAFSASNEPFTGDDGQLINLEFEIFGVGGWYPLQLSNVFITAPEEDNMVSAFYNGGLEVAAPDIHASSTVAFGDVSVLETATQILRINNYGSDVLAIHQLQTSNNAFWTSQALPLQIQTGAYHDLEVSFQKGQKGSQQGILQIFSNDPDENPFNVELHANAFAPNYIRLPDVTKGQTSTLLMDLLVDNHEPFVAFECKMHFPSDIMTFLPDASFTHLSSRAQGHIMNTNLEDDGVLRVFAYSLSQEQFTGQTGAVAHLGFSVHAPQNDISHPISLSQCILSDQQGKNILYDVTNGSITITESSVPDHLPITNRTLSSGETDCLNANQTITLAGQGGSFITEAGSSTTMIAGEKISMLPGTRLQAGSFVHAYITPEGPFCEEPDKQIMAVDAEPERSEVPSESEGSPLDVKAGSLFKLYPNPTSGMFTLELNSFYKETIVMVEVYGIRGEQVLRKELPSDLHQHELSLEGQVPGIYIIRVVSGQDVGVKQIIKQ